MHETTGVRPTTPARGAYRPDVEGLRAVAILAVLLTHAGVPFLAGGYVGVDIFFVISGFLITRLLLGEVERTGRISLVAFYVRRIRRLMPQAMTALAAVVVLSALLLSPVRADAVARDVMAAGAYAINWRFSAQASDYFAVGSEDSPLAHFWSLAVEEQFYLAWPVLLMALMWGCTRLGVGRRVPLAVALSVIAACSFGYALHLAASAPSQAYFSTPARVWELAAGGLVAVLLARRSLAGRPAAVAAWAGAAAIAVATVVCDGGSGFPGAAALLPTLGAVALILAGSSTMPTMPARLLSTSPMRRVGRLSYAWYIWHWPALVFTAAAFGPLSYPEGLLVVAASLIPTVITHRWIEQPGRRLMIHRRRPWSALAAGPAGALTAVGLGLGLIVALPSTPTLARGKAEGASQLQRTGTIQRAAAALRPAPRNADDDRPRVNDEGCAVQLEQTTSPPCIYGRRNAKTTVVLFGDSHAAQYFSALEPIALRRGWRLIHLTKAGCPPARVHLIDRTMHREYPECDVWRERALRRIEHEHPRLVVTSSQTDYLVAAGGKRLGEDAARRALAEGYVWTLKRLRRAATAVVALRDVPEPPRDVPSCVSEALHDLLRCAFSRAAAFDRPDVVTDAIRTVDGIELIDPTSQYCLRDLCPAVIGNVLVYRNSGHITATYIETMTGWLDRRLRRSMSAGLASAESGAEPGCALVTR